MDSQLIRTAEHCVLRESHRQSDQTYLGALNDLRSGQVTDLVRQVFYPRRSTLAQKHEHAIVCYATNTLTRAYNLARLSEMPSHLVSVSMTATLQDLRSDYMREKWPMEGYRQDEILSEAARLAHQTAFKVGCRVIITKNDASGLWVNGDAGKLVDVELMDGTRVSDMRAESAWDMGVTSDKIACLHILLDRDAEAGLDTPVAMSSIMLTSNGEPKVTSDTEWVARGFPVKLGWAATAHWLQGCTVDHLYVDMASICAMPGDSRHGLAYVAFSRTRTLEGLQIDNWSDNAVHCAEAVRPFV
jgi:hypothetical protein